MSKKWDTLVYIGRFQPVHTAHAETIRRAQSLAKQVIIIIGSADLPRTFKNPWTAAERAVMLQSVIHGPTTGPDACMVRLEKTFDSMYNDDAWKARIQSIVAKHTQPTDKVAIIGHDKDESTFYLKSFPQWGQEKVELIEPLNATSIRDIYFTENPNLNFLQGVVPNNVLQIMQGFKNTKDFEQIVQERKFLLMHAKQYEHLKYEPVFLTGDAVVVQSGHILLIRRKAEPGKGLWALPGGYLRADKDKTLLDCAIRELIEETQINVPEKVLRGSVVSEKIFSGINRSPRGRIVTNAVKIVLAEGEWKLPKVKGTDDAEFANWFSFNDIKRSMMFEDHYDIIEDMTGAL